MSPKTKEIVRDITLITGVVSLVAGIAMIFVPAAFIATGLLLLTISIRGV